jgi:hypothetical protein
MAIYVPLEQKHGIDHDLISTVDIKEILLNLLFKGVSPIKGTERKYIFSRNRYANQSVKRYSFNKSYVVSDGVYSLMVSSKGLELYNNVMDICNMCNILEFFLMGNDGKIQYNKRFAKAKSDHYSSFYTEDEVVCVKNKFYELYIELRKFVNQMYKAGNVDQGKIDKELKFKSINYIHGYNLYNGDILNQLEKINKYG